MASPVMMKITCLAIMMCLVLRIPVAESVTCGQVTGVLAPCLVYLSGGATVLATCCNGARVINNLAKTTPDRQAACICIKGALKAASGILKYGIQPDALSAIPSKCGIQLPFQISLTMDCSKVQ